MITYSTNWMGPISKEWYTQRNLEPWTYSAGRIDCRGDGLGEYGDEIALPPMPNEDWGRFSQWLKTVKTEKLVFLKELIAMYEATNPKINWWEND